MAKTYETLIYYQRQAFLAWRSRLGILGQPTTPETENTVWELLVLLATSLTSPSIENDEEISQVAYDLAVLVLKNSSIRDLNRFYRDALIESVLHNMSSAENAAEQMIRFSNLLSNSFSKADTDPLRRTISRQHASRLSEELHLAKQIQDRLMPKHIPQIPGFQMAGRLVPAFEVGGDYWSCKYYKDDGIVTMKLADISGHGIAAATLVAAVKFISGGYYRAAKSAHEVIERTNKILVAETPVEILVTMVYAWLHPETREVDVVNAGHEPAFICTGDTCIDIPPTGPVLGVIPDTEYSERTYKLSPGDIIVFGSDGIIEAGIAEQFGTARVKELVYENREKSADEIADIIIRAVKDYAGQPHDDMSLVVVKSVDESAA